MNLFEISTTSYMEENFLLVTDLELEQIKEVINTMVKDERNNDFLFMNDEYVAKLKLIYPKYYIEIHQPEKIYF